MDPRSDDAPGRLESDLLRQFDQIGAQIDHCRRLVMRRLILLRGEPSGLPCSGDGPVAPSYETLTHCCALPEDIADQRDEPPSVPA